MLINSLSCFHVLTSPHSSSPRARGHHPDLWGFVDPLPFVLCISLSPKLILHSTRDICEQTHRRCHFLSLSFTKREMGGLLFLVLLIAASNSKAALLSSSSIQQCIRDGTSMEPSKQGAACRKKLIVTLAINSGQVWSRRSRAFALCSFYSLEWQ